MPIVKNNQGFGYLPIIAISALVLTGTYFGYTWYTNSLNSTVENTDVLAGATLVKTPTRPSSTPAFPANYNPENVPMMWGFNDDSKAGTWNIYTFYTAKDVKKLEALMNKIKNTKAFSVRVTKTPCYDNGSRGVVDLYDTEVQKLADDFYMVAIKGINTYYQSPLDKKCAISSTAPFIYRGADFNEVVNAPATIATPQPASYLYNLGPAYKQLPIDVTKLKKF